MSFRPATFPSQAPRTFANMLHESSLRARALRQQTLLEYAAPFGKVEPFVNLEAPVVAAIQKPAQLEPLANVQWARPRPVVVRNNPAPIPPVQTAVLPLITLPENVIPRFDQAVRIAPKVPQVAKSAVSPTMQALRIRGNELRKALELKVAEANAELPRGCHLRAWPILPVETFMGETGMFLMIACELFEASPANTMLLPTLPNGMAHFGLPRHPLFASDDLKQDAVRRVTQLCKRMAAQNMRVAGAISRGNVDALYKRSEYAQSYVIELQGILKDLAVQTFGLAAWETHKRHFKTTLMPEPAHDQPR